MKTCPRMALCALALGASTAGAAVPNYTQFELEARTNLLVNDNGYQLPPGSSFNSISAAIDDAAQVAFRVQLVPDAQDSSQYRPGLWYGGHGAGGIVYSGPIDASIDDDVCLVNGSNAFVYIPFTLSDDEGFGNSLYLYSQDSEGSGGAAEIATAPVIADSYSSACMTTAGTFSFQAHYASGRAYVNIVDNGSGNTVTQFVGDANVSPGSPYTYLYTPASNDSGAIAAKVALSSDFTSALEIRVFADGTSQLILANTGRDPTSPYSTFDNSLAVNHAGVVAVVATRADDHRRVVLRSDGTSTTEIAAVDPAGTIRDIEFFFAPSINDAGMVVFRAKDANGQALYVGDGTVLTRVIGNGDVVATDLGSAQIGQDNDSDPIFSGRPTLNNRGDIAFVAGLYPAGDNQTEWGSGVFVAYAAVNDTVFADGFDG